MQHPLQAVADREINQPEIKCEQKHGNNDDRSRGLNLFSRRRRNLLYLRAHVVIKRLDPLRPGPDRRYKRILFYSCRHTFPLSSTAPSRASNSGRGGGIRTPKFGFGDRQFSR